MSSYAVTTAKVPEKISDYIDFGADKSASNLSGNKIKPYKKPDNIKIEMPKDRNFGKIKNQKTSKIKPYNKPNNIKIEIPNDSNFGKIRNQDISKSIPAMENLPENE